MARMDEFVELVRRTASDIGVAPLARRAGTSPHIVRGIVRGDAKMIKEFGSLELVAEAHAEEQRLKWAAEHPAATGSEAA